MVGAERMGGGLLMRFRMRCWQFVRALVTEVRVCVCVRVRG